MREREAVPEADLCKVNCRKGKVASSEGALFPAFFDFLRSPSFWLGRRAVGLQGLFFFFSLFFSPRLDRDASIALFPPFLFFFSSSRLHSPSCHYCTPCTEQNNSRTFESLQCRPAQFSASDPDAPRPPPEPLCTSPRARLASLGGSRPSESREWACMPPRSPRRSRVKQHGQFYSRRTPEDPIPIRPSYLCFFFFSLGSIGYGQAVGCAPSVFAQQVRRLLFSMICASLDAVRSVAFRNGN